MSTHDESWDDGSVGDEGNDGDSLFEFGGNKYDLSSPEQADKLKTSLTSYYEDYTKKGQLLKNPQELLSYLGENYPDYLPSNQQQEQLSDEDAQRNRIIEEAEKYGLITRGSLQKEIQLFFDMKRIGETMTNLEKTIDGSDGRPKFDRREVLEFMDNHRIGDPEAAYDWMHKTALDEWKIQKYAQGGKKPVYSERGGSSGVHAPGAKKAPRLDDVNMAAFVAEELEKALRGRE